MKSQHRGMSYRPLDRSPQGSCNRTGIAIKRAIRVHLNPENDLTVKEMPLRSFTTVLAWLLLILSAPEAQAHASLSHASPSGGSALTTAPQKVTLTFTDTLEAAFSTIRVTDANGDEVSQGKAQVNGNMMGVTLKPLTAGTYKVNWRAVSTDTHRTEGNFTFSVEAH
jgi:copper resistance protein C